MNQVVDWNDIHNSVLKALGEQRMGWADQLVLVLEDVKLSVAQRPDIFGTKLPVVVQIKQKLGGLRVYTRKMQSKYLRRAGDTCREDQEVV
ncbi:hypothetical protein [Ruegeria profundi]|uniref:Uncharacterized protein n=1 Tax=Ruegeria profundi TaxID=1685378 RepID=A0A0X3TQ17_9RHOB|nr:hypothetical protein [Ruegeria profundi]KUJ77803.1 hypothetical protein AVO44_15890 [Ruegeria profundi]